MPQAPIIERAFELAGSGECSTMRELERRLTSEGYIRVADHVRGSSIRQQLRALIENGQARSMPTAANVLEQFTGD